MSVDYTKTRARRLQEKLNVPYTKALRIAQTIEHAANHQVVTDPEIWINSPINERDLYLVGLLGPAWELSIFDMEQAYRSINCVVSDSNDHTYRSYFVSLDYKNGRESYTDTPTLRMSIDPEGANNFVADIDTSGSVQEVVDRINKALSENLPGFRGGVKPDMVGDWS